MGFAGVFCYFPYSPLYIDFFTLMTHLPFDFLPFADFFQQQKYFARLVVLWSCFGPLQVLLLNGRV